ncbi:MAG: LysR family transcriptional regulator [Oxalicibacterium faecigallinarum]|uniref:LysR family transcriptional regulator n=1 Tax=Oxalicibacterium faecigallinarum TaxID=573741 RepID=UPI002806B141|nr:LysR family transcriptional regulator [Oxalicibacterium faecigallinarum]MDQ7968328.1 LysR family transcriptional regulator [Oxalicibacterium faecigallinarum]
MNKLEAMQVFRRVAELASFTRAAESLGLPKASVSTSVQQLESLLGTRLLHRTTRKVQLTQDGIAFYARCRDLLSDVEELETLFAHTPGALHGRLRVDMPTGVAKNLVIPQLPAFLEQHPGIEIELSSTDRRVDLVQEGFDCVLRIGMLSDSGLIARSLGEFDMVNCVSPAYVARYGIPMHLDDLDAHMMVGYATTLGTKPYPFEYLDTTAGSGVYAWRMLKANVTVNNAESYSNACLAGLGIIQVPRVSAREQLLDGSFIEVLPALMARPMPISLLYPNRRHLPKRVQVFMDWLSELMQTYR